MSHQSAVRDLCPAGGEGTADWSVAADCLVLSRPPALQPQPAAEGVVRTDHLPVLTLSLVLAQSGPHELHQAALLAVLAGHGDLVQQPLGEVEPGPGLESTPALRTGPNLGTTGAADDVALGGTVSSRGAGRQSSPDSPCHTGRWAGSWAQSDRQGTRSAVSNPPTE